MTNEKVERKSYLEKRKQKKAREQQEEEIVNVSKAEHFFENNYQKIILGVVAVVAIAAILTFITNTGKGKEKKAQVAAVGAQKAFQQQQWQTAIDGNEEFAGFTAIADDYQKTNIGNLAHYYLGISYMKTGEYEKALNELEQYKQTSDPNINGLAYMNMGDASMELGNTAQAVEYYKQAANTDSEAYQADFLIRYGMAQLKVNDNTGAKATFERITQNFPNSTQSNIAEQYIAGL